VIRAWAERSVESWLDEVSQQWHDEIEEAARSGRPAYVPLRFWLVTRAGVVIFLLHSAWHQIGFAWCPLDCPVSRARGAR